MARHSTARPTDGKKRRFRSQASCLRGGGTRKATRPRQMRHSKRTERGIPQPHAGEAAPFPQPEQRPIECLPQEIIAASDHNADAFAEKTALKIRAAAEHAAVRGVGAIEPKGKRDAVTKKEVDFASLQRKAPSVSVRIRPNL